MTARLIAHPVVVLRVGGLPYEAGRLASGDTVARIEAGRRIAAEIGGSTASVCAALAACVPALYDKDPGLARSLIQIKRDFFNGRVPPASALRAVAGALPQDLETAVQDLSALIAEARRCAGEVDACHGREISAAQDQLLARLADRDLGRAIEVTNPAVHAQLSALAAGQGSISRKDRNLLTASLARYVLRASRKTSPLSSFGIVAVGTWDGRPWPQAAGDPIAALPAAIETGGGLRLAALEYVFHALLRRVEEVGGGAPLALNSSLVRGGTGFEWLRIVTDDPPESRTRGTRTARVRSDAPAVTLLERLFSSLPEGAMTLAELRAALAAILGPGSEGRAEAVLATGWQSGLIGPLLPAAGGPAAWSRAAAQALASPRREEVAAALEGLIAAAACEGGRPGRVREVERHFAALLAAAGMSEPVERFRPLLFEDCTAPPGSFSLPTGMVEAFRPELTALLEAMPVLTAGSPLGGFRARILAFFLQRFGDGGVCTEVYRFANDFAAYMDEVAKGRASIGADLPAGAGSEGGEHPAGPARRAREAFLGDLAARARNGAELVLAPEELRRLAQGGAGGPPPRAVSNMFFAQLAQGAGDPLLVINHIYSGGGGMITRFLPGDEAVIAPVRDYLRDIAEDGGYAELPGLFGFNANLHPRLADRALAIPPFPQVAGPEPLALDALRLRHCPARGELVFEDAAGRPVSIFYLGLLTPVLMPHMHQMIHALSFTAGRLDALWLDIAARLGPDGRGVVAIPRIRIGNLVLVRRMWGTGKADLPPSDLAEVPFFVRFGSWARDIGLPRHLFFHRLSVPGLPKAESEGADKPTRSSRLPKPMALDRDCPLAVRLLQRSLASSDRHVLFVEALPEGEDTGVSRGGAAVAAEIGFELTLKSAA